MLEIQKIEFNKYYNNFDIKEESINKKYLHSLRVMDHAINIANSLNLSDTLVEVIGTAGLLHDIGRFKQWEDYKTFYDINSVDHAKLGSDILSKNNYISKYILNEKYIDLVIEAVYEHNKYKIKEGLDFNTEIVCKIVRDADKLDILEMQNNYEIDSNIEINKEYIDNIYKRKCCVNTNKENEADKVIKQICFLYDINFQYSLNYLYDKGILHNKFYAIRNNKSGDVNISDLEREVTNYLKSLISK